MPYFSDLVPYLSWVNNYKIRGHSSEQLFNFITISIGNQNTPILISYPTLQSICIANIHFMLYHGLLLLLVNSNQPVFNGPGGWSSIPPLHLGVVAIEKGALGYLDCGH